MFLFRDVAGGPGSRRGRDGGGVLSRSLCPVSTGGGGHSFLGRCHPSYSRVCTKALAQQVVSAAK
jgi:hypothetical protein